MSENETVQQVELPGTPPRIANWFHWVSLGSAMMADTYDMLTLAMNLPDHRLEPGDRETLTRARVVFNRLIQMQLGEVGWTDALEEGLKRFNKVADKAIKATERDQKAQVEP